MFKKIRIDLIKKVDIILIFKNSFFKIMRGFYFKLFLKSSKSLLFVGKSVEINHCKCIEVGKYVKFERFCEIQGLSTKGLIFKDNVTIGSHTMIRPSSYYGTEIGEGLIIGNNSSIGPFGYVGCSGYIRIGNNVMIGPKVSLFAENHVFKDVNEPIKYQGVERKGIIIEDDCWIGSGVIILDGVKIGMGSVIAAGTIVSKDVSPYSLVLDKRVKKTMSRK